MMRFSDANSTRRILFKIFKKSSTLDLVRLRRHSVLTWKIYLLFCDNCVQKYEKISHAEIKTLCNN